MRALLTLVILIVLLFVGCSNNETPIVYSVQEDYGMTEHVLLGMWTVDFDLATQNVAVESVRSTEVHLNVTELIPPPYITINHIYPNYVINIDVTLTNPYPNDAFDVRLIIFTDIMGKRLENPDHWTDLYDVSGSLPINPFKAYAKDEPNRKFASYAQYTENLSIFIPPGHQDDVQFAVDVSLPGNCEEPYKISGFTHGVIYDEIGSSAEVEVNVYDWQEDVDSVNLYCPEITNQQLLPFTQTDPERWGTTLVNSTGASVGEYPGYIIATSTNSDQPLYDVAVINISSIITAPWSEADPISLQDIINGSVNQGEEDWFIFYCPPNGIDAGSINMTVHGGTAKMIIHGSDPGEGRPGMEIADNNHIIIQHHSNSRYYIQIIGISGQVDYELETNVAPKITNINCEIYVATDDGTEIGTWPIRESYNEELTIETLNAMMTWCNNFYNQYGYNFVWDGTVTIMSAEYYNVEWPEDEEMHDEYGRGTDMLSLYFVQSGWTAYTIPRYPESEQTVDSVFSVYSPNIWNIEDVIAHEHGHEIGYLVDQYLYDMVPCECGDWECLEQYVGEEALYLYSCPDACYEGNLMWYGYYSLGWDEYDLTLRSQAQWIYGFHFRNPNNFPWY